MIIELDDGLKLRITKESAGNTRLELFAAKAHWFGEFVQHSGTLVTASYRPDALHRNRAETRTQGDEG